MRDSTFVLPAFSPFSIAASDHHVFYPDAFMSLGFYFSLFAYVIAWSMRGDSLFPIYINVGAGVFWWLFGPPTPNLCKWV